jgi:hypothetical protein
MGDSGDTIRGGKVGQKGRLLGARAEKQQGSADCALRYRLRHSSVGFWRKRKWDD